MSTGLLHQEMRRTYAAQRGVSQGASITLAAVSGGFQARFDCAHKCATVLDTRNSQGELFHIPMQDAFSSISKLAETFSVALVDTVTDDQGTRFVLVWKIVPSKPQLLVPTAEGGYAPMQVADALEVLVNSHDNLDEY